MKKMNVFQKFIKSIVDVKSYVIFLREKTSKAIFYILLLSIIFGAIKGFTLSLGIQKIVDETKSYLTENKDVLKLEKGELTLSKEPLTIKGNGYLVLADTNYTYDTYEQKKLSELNVENYSTSVLLFKDRVILNANGQQTVQKYPNVANTLTYKDAMNSLNFSKGVWVVVITISIIMAFIGNLILALVIALFGTVATYMLKVRVRFKAMYRIALYSMTLAIIIEGILGAIGVIIPSFTLLFLIISITYIWRALKVIKEEVSEDELYEIG